MEPTPAQIADHLDEMHDLLLERGRARGTFGTSRGGPACLVGASLILGAGMSTFALHRAALDHLARKMRETYRKGTHSLMFWNDQASTTDDMVFDLLRSTAKELRDA